MKLFFLILLVGLFTMSAIGQDSTKTHDRDNFQKKEQKKSKWDENAQKQKQERTNRFVDLDGDGINDVAMERLDKMLRKGEVHKDGNVEGSGEMERSQIRTRTGDPTGPGPQSGDQQKNKDTKGKK